MSTDDGRDPRLANVCVAMLAPGAWIDGNGALHFDIPAIHEHLGLPNTPEGIEESRRILDELLREMHPEIVLHHRYTPEDV